MIGLFLVLQVALLTSEWQSFQSIEGGFQVEVPGQLEHTMQQIATEVGTVDFHTYYLAQESDTAGNFIYMVSYYRSESLKITADSFTLLQEFFAATVDQAAQSVSGDVLILDEITYNRQFPGRLWRIHYNQGRSVLKTRAFLIDDTFYSIQVAVDASFSLRDQVDRFLNSFKLLVPKN